MLPLGPVCTVYVLFLASDHRGIPLVVIIIIVVVVIIILIVETLNYANIVCRIDYLLFITSKCKTKKEQNNALYLWDGNFNTYPLAF